MNKKELYEALKAWGRGNRREPAGGALLKEKVLSRIPVSPESLRGDAGPSRGFSWLPAAFAALSVIVFVAGAFDSERLKYAAVPDVPGNTAQYEASSPSAPAIQNSMSFPESAAKTDTDAAYYGYGVYGYGAPITDTREFLKTYYNAMVRTRNVNRTKVQIESLIRGLGGRIDASSGGEKHGYIQYAIPAARLETFENDLKGLAGEKFVTERVNSENLLPRKQAIEREERQAEESIAELSREKARVSAEHTAAARSLESRLAALSREMLALGTEYQTATPARRGQISVRLAELQSQKSDLDAKLANENSNYRRKLAGINARIDGEESRLDTVRDEDRNLLDNVATVNGTINLSRVSLWGAADIYMPGPLLGWLLLLAALLLYARRFAYL